MNGTFGVDQTENLAPHVHSIRGPWRTSILLVAGDKAGRWNTWYRHAIPLAVVISHRLAEVRRARNMTQQQVADEMSVTKGRVSQIEQGKISGTPLESSSPAQCNS